MAPHAEQQRVLRQAGFLADASMSGLVVWLPVSMLLLEVSIWLVCLGLLLTMFGLLMPLLLGAVAVAWLLVGQALVLQTEAAHRLVSTRVRLNMQSVSLAGRTVPLEDITALKVRRSGLQLVTLEAHRRSGRPRVVAFGGHLENMEVLAQVIRAQRVERIAQLHAEGRDLSKPASVPAALDALRQRP